MSEIPIDMSDFFSSDSHRFFSGKIPSFRLLNTFTKTVCRVWDEDHQAGKKVPVKSQLTASHCLFWAHGFWLIRMTKFVVDVRDQKVSPTTR